MTRTHTKRPVWVWKCDYCGQEEFLAREQYFLPSKDEMRERGWFIGQRFGDRCPTCNRVSELLGQAKEKK